MIYPYKCEKCETETDIAKSMNDASREEFCDKCGGSLTRIYLGAYLSKTKVENAEYNPGLGCVTKGAYDRSEKAKRRGLEEIGSDFGSGEKMIDTFDADRKAKREKSWEEV